MLDKIANLVRKAIRAIPLCSVLAAFISGWMAVGYFTTVMAQ